MPSFRPRSTVSAVLAVFALLAPSVPVFGATDKLGEMPRLFGSFNPKMGVWSEYAVQEKETGKRSTMRMAIVGQEGDSSWYEVLMDDGENRNIVKMLLKGSPNDPDNIQRMIMKSGDAPATEMAKDFVAMGRKMAAYMFETRSGVPAEPGQDLRLESAEPREVVVPAGTFQATLKKIVDAQGKVLATYDYEPNVLPFGVVTSDTAQTRMELTAYGNDAKSLITETPVQLSGPPRMPPNMPQGMPPGMKRPGPKP